MGICRPPLTEQMQIPSSPSLLSQRLSVRNDKWMLLDRSCER